MELRRSRKTLVFGIGFTVAAAVALLCAWGSSSAAATPVYVVFGIIGLVAAVALVGNQLRPFRFGIGPQGLALRAHGINRLVPWTEIDALVLDQPLPIPGSRRHLVPAPHLVLVPVSGSPLAARRDQQSLPDGRRGLVVLELDEVKDSPERIREVLQTYGGGRFTDALRERESRVGKHEFALTLRGYDPDVVDGLIRSAAQALGSGGWAACRTARLQIEGTSIPVTNRGYDRRQVDSALREITARLAQFSPDR